jgi:hypothetical protein
VSPVKRYDVAIDPVFAIAVVHGPEGDDAVRI